MLQCQSSWCGYEIEVDTALKYGDHGEQGCPECAGHMAPKLTDMMRLTVLRQILRSALTTCTGSHQITMWDRLVDLRVDLDEVFGPHVPPMSTPPYSLEELATMQYAISPPG